MHMSILLSIHGSRDAPLYMSMHISMNMSLYMSMHISMHMSLYMSIHRYKMDTTLRYTLLYHIFIVFWVVRHPMHAAGSLFTCLHTCLYTCHAFISGCRVLTVACVAATRRR